MPAEKSDKAQEQLSPDEARQVIKAIEDVEREEAEQQAKRAEDK